MKNSIKLKGRMKSYIQSSLYLGFLLIAVNILIYFIDYRAGIVLSGFILFYFGIVLYMMFYNKPVIMNELVSFATQYGQIQKRLLRDLELPHALLDESGRIIWTNIAFERMVHQEKGYRKSVTSLFPSITRDKLPGENEEDEVEFDVEFEAGNYIAKLKKISLREMAENSDIIEAKGYDGYLIALYLFDETALKIALREVDNQSLAVGLIYLDNYDEALESVEEVRRSLLIALIDRKVNKYIAALDGICRKLEKDKYFVIMRKESAVQLQENRFDLLEDVKTVNIGNEMAVTISIGMGYNGLSYSQNYEFARNAIDIALGRGGDQAVVKVPENVTYYGGKSQQIEKSTRVKARVKAHAFKEIVSVKDEVYVMGHRMGDADSFGASVGIYRIAKTLDKTAHIVLNDIGASMQPMVDMFRNNDEYEENMIINNTQALEMVGNNAVLVVVDVSKPSITECPE
ncbi:MAG: DHH family phosphoesterase, partial [Lachnospiraceae bacterium]|nr:DHH family phosphoesterase [Lachnospiraceae bacterium]